MKRIILFAVCVCAITTSCKKAEIEFQQSGPTELNIIDYPDGSDGSHYAAIESTSNEETNITYIVKGTGLTISGNEFFYTDTLTADISLGIDIIQILPVAYNKDDVEITYIRYN